MVHALEQALARRVTVDRRVPGAGPVNELHRHLAHRRISAVGLDLAALEGLRQMILAGGPRQLAVGDLRADDLARLAWSGNPAHLRSVAAALQRAAQGMED